MKSMAPDGQHDRSDGRPLAISCPIRHVFGSVNGEVYGFDVSMRPNQVMGPK